MNGMEIVENLKPVKFKYNKKLPELKKNDNRFHIGFIAQDLTKIFPMDEFAIVGEKDGYLYVNYHELIPILVMALKEQKVRIEELEKKING